MKEDNISQLGDYDAPFCEQQYTHRSCYILLFKFKSFDQLIPPQTVLNFRHLLSCGTKDLVQRRTDDIFLNCKEIGWLGNAHFALKSEIFHPRCWQPCHFSCIEISDVREFMDAGHHKSAI